MAAAVGVAKCGSGSFGQMVVKGIFCNYLVCMAIFLATQARDARVDGVHLFSKVDLGPVVEEFLRADGPGHIT